MKTSKDMARKPGQAKPATTGKPASNGKPAAPSAQAAPRSSLGANAARSAAGAPRGTTTGRPTTGTRPGTPGTRPGAPGQRPRALPPKKTGFRMRPVDMVITGVAVLVIGLIVWAVWSSASGAGTGTANTGPVVDPNTGQPVPDAHMIPVGQPVPDFTLPGTDGKTYSLSQFKGKPVFLEFMAPWCPHCQADSTIINQVYDAYASKGVVFLGVNASPYGINHENGDNSPITMNDQQQFVSQFGLKYPLLFDAPKDAGGGQLDTTQRPIYGIDFFPSIYILDKDQKVSAHVVADTNKAITADWIESELDKVLK